MGLQLQKTKKNTGLLPQFENVLTTNIRYPSGINNTEEKQIDFPSIRKSVQRLYDQSPAIPQVQFVCEFSGLLKSVLNTEHLWIARFDFNNDQLEILAGCSNRKSGMKVPLPLFMDSPFSHVIQGLPYVCPRNAAIAYSNNPYMIKFNIDSVIAQPLFLDNTCIGFLSVMNSTPIEYPVEIAHLFENISPELTRILFAKGQTK